MTEIIEGSAVRLEPNQGLQEATGWKGDLPVFLIIEPADGVGGNVGIDLDTPWMTEHAAHLRRPGTWWLVAKMTGRPMLSVVVHEGDQPYYTKRHVGDLMSGREVEALGIGKKRADGIVERLWILPNGVVCGGDDVDHLAARML